MKIEEETAQRLVLADPRRPVAAAIIFGITAFCFLVVAPAAVIQNGPFAGLVAVAGSFLPLALGLLVLRRSRAVFDGDRRMLEVRRAVFAKAKTWTVPFDEIEEVYLLRSNNGEGGPPGFLPYIATRGGSVQLTLAVYDRETADAALDAATRFLTNAGIPVQHREKPRNWALMKERPEDP